MDFAAIDFETANNERSSACQVGIALVRENRVVDTYCSLIRPPTQDFYEAYVRLHGITAQRVRKAPTFREVWPEIQSRCVTGLLAAHNAVFDVGVLISCAEGCGLGRLSGSYLCTLTLARAVLPGLPNHQLATLTAEFGIPNKHHDALSDAVACAELAIRLMSLAGAETIAQYSHLIADFGGGGKTDTKLRHVAVTLPPGEVEVAAPHACFQGKHFVFTGELTSLGRAQATHLVEAQSGRVGNSVSSKTDYLVVGVGAFKRNGEPTAKLAGAMDIQHAGGSIQIIDEAEFLQMLR